MSVVRVDPESIRNYSRRASEHFAQMRDQLDLLCSDVVGVRYDGPNAQAFKTQCGELAVTFANAMMGDLNNIAEAVRTSTSNISASLGGQQVAIDFDGSPVPHPQVPAASHIVDVDTSALQALRPVVTQRFDAIQSALSAHLNALEATDWIGQAKTGAVEAVGRFTASARGKATDAQSSINTTIDQQITAVQAADH